MKRFFTILSCLIVAMVAMSCGSKVEKDIKAIAGDEFKVCDVKSIDIKSNFYTITNEYTENLSKYENCRESTRGNGDIMRMYESDMKLYKSWGYQDDYNRSKEGYEMYKALWEDDCKRLDEYAEKNKHFLENGSQTGKVYIAKVKGNDEFTGKPLGFYSYQIFAYDSDGSLHPVDTGRDMQMICSVYPKAKKDIEKAMGKVQEMMLDALSNLDI